MTARTGTPPGSASPDAHPRGRRRGAPAPDYRAIVDASMEPLVVLAAERDHAGEIVDFSYSYLNPAACEFLAVSLHEVVGQLYSRSTPAGGSFEMHRRVVLTGEPYRRRVSYRGLLFGRPTALLVDTAVARLGDGIVVSLGRGREGIGAGDARRVEDETGGGAGAQGEISEDRYRDLLAGMAEGVTETTPEGSFVAVNRAFAKMLGYDSAEDLMAHVSNAVELHATPAQRTIEVQRVAAAATGEVTCSPDLEFRRKDGSMIWLRARSTVRRSPSGAVIGIRAICEDVTASRAVSRQLSAIVDASDDAIISADLAGTVTGWNRAAERLFGYTAAEITGMPISWIAPDRITEQSQLRARLGAGGPQERFETVRRRKDGSAVEVLLTASGTTDAAGRVVGLAVILRDIADQRRARSALRTSEHRLSEAQRIAHIGSFTFDAASGRLTWSDEFCRILGLDPAVEPTIELFMSLVHPDDAPAIADGWTNAAERRLPFDVEVRILRAGADERRVHVRAVPEYADDGTIQVVAGTMMDDTALAEALEVQRAAETRFEIGFEQTTVGAVIADLDGVPIRVNSAACALLGRPREALIGLRWPVFVHPDDVPLAHLAIARVMDGHDTHHDERRYVQPDGTVVWASVHVTLVHDEAGAPQYFFTHLYDITERKRMEDELAHQALHDALTGLPNRALLTDRLHHSLALAGRTGASVAVLFLDIDHFKVVNDSLGHTIGDDLLRLVAARVAATIRPGDTVARFGGDEFVIVADDVTVLESEQIAERLLDALARPCLVGGEEINVTASVGIAITDGTATPDTILRDSDAAMYRAKERGRGRAELFDDALRSKAEHRMVTTSALHHAIERDEFTLLYQPVVALASGELAGAEALLRWDHPKGCPVALENFIPMAEQTGLIVPIGAWVLERACRQLAEWQDLRPSMGVSVNISVRQMLAEGFLELVAGVLDRTGVAAGGVCLELTESVFMEDVDYFGATLASLKALGVRLAIDDFGMGYSSLSYLNRFPVDAVKVDRSFVDGLGTEAHDSALVAAIIAMAAALGLDVTAEGVETRGQVDILRSLRCQKVQGFHLARPMSAAALGRLIADGHRWQVD